MATHPSLFFDAGYLVGVRRSLDNGVPPPELIAGGADWAKAVERARQAAQEPLLVSLQIKTEADQFADTRFDLGTGKYTTPDGAPPPEFSNDMLTRDIGRKLGSLVYGAALSEDAELIETTKQALFAGIERACWTSPEDFEVNSSPYPHSSMRMTRFMSTVGITYDCLYGHLTEAERQRVCALLVSRGLEPTCDDLGASDCLRWPNGYTEMLGGMGVAALAIHQEMEVARFARRAVACAVEFLDLHAPDGSMLEGYGYGKMGIGPIVTFLVALERSGLADGLGKPLAERIAGHPAFPRILDFIIAFATRDGKQAIGFGDCSPVTSAGGYDGYLKYLSSRGSGQAEWMLRSLAGRALAEPAVAGRVKPIEPAFRSAAFPTSGVAVLRDPRPETPMLGFKCGPPNVEVLHNHYDQNHVVVWHKDKLVLWDPGYHRELYAFGTEGHNTLLVDGRGQDVVIEEGQEVRFGADVKAAREQDLLWGLAGTTLTQFVTTEVADLVSGAAAHAYNKHAHRVRYFDRYAVFVRPGYFVLHDRLCAQWPRVFSLLFHGAPGSRIETHDQGARIVQDDAALDIVMGTPGGWSLSEKCALAKFEHAPYVEFALPEATKTAATTVLVPSAPEDELPRVEYFEDGVRGVAVSRDDHTDLMLFGLDDPAPLRWQDLEIDLFGVHAAVVRVGADGEARDVTALLPKGAEMAPIRRLGA